MMLIRLSLVALTLAILLVDCCRREPQRGECQEKWREFKLEYSKDYANKEEEIRRIHFFCENLQLIEDYNRKLGRAQLQVNGLADLSQPEIQRLTMSDGGEFADSLRKEVAKSGLGRVETTNSTRSLPDWLDWSADSSIVGPVHDQGDCGSCWAFTSVSLIEGRQHYRFPGKKVVPLSAQQLVDCDGLSAGCLGGLPGQAFEYIRKAGGIESDQDYPYVSGELGLSQECKFNSSQIQESTRNVGKLWYDYSREGDEQFLQRMLAENEPIAILFRAGQPFVFAKDNVIYDETCEENDVPNHGVLLVGYGTNKRGEEYWKVKNTWGKQWGVNGYGYMARNRNNNCGVASNPIMLKGTQLVGVSYQ